MIESLKDLENPCELCSGKGTRVDITSEEGFVECYKCDGSGYIPTLIGARILALIRHNSRVKVSAELRVCGVD